MSANLADPEIIEFAPGGATGIVMPAHAEALRQAGAEWLTKAFHAYGALAADNAVTAITGLEPFAAGNSGDKLRLSVEYARTAPDLHTELFVKFSRCFGDAFRDRRRHELDGEVRLASLSRNPAFPVAVAKPYFADIDPESGTGVLITERVLYGQNGVEPIRHKNMDHELDDPAEYYRATVTALARLAAAHQSGQLGEEADRLFPFDAQAAAADLPLPWDETQVRAKAETMASFIAECPRLFTPNVRTADFAERLVRDAVQFQRHDADVRRFLFADPRFIALAHWNTHIDNAWFWRDEQGVLRAGLLDWGMVRQMNLAIALWGGLSGASAEVWDASLEHFISTFVEELDSHGGARIDPAELRLHLDLAVATMAMALMFDLPALFHARMPDVAELVDLHDPLIARDKVVQGMMHAISVCLNLWERHDFGASLATMLERIAAAD